MQKAVLIRRSLRGVWIKGAVNLPVFGVPSFGISAFGIPIFEIPDFGIPGFGISVLGRVPVWVFPTFGIPAFGIPVFGIPPVGINAFGIPIEFRHPLFRHALNSPQVNQLLMQRLNFPGTWADAAIQLRMRMRILTRPRNSQANSGHQISKEKLRIKRCEGMRLRFAGINSGEKR